MLDYRDLHPGQWEVAQSDARFRYLVCGRGWGKDYFAISDTIQAVTSERAGPGFYALYVGPSHNQVKKIAWERWKRAIPKSYLARPPHETELRIQLRWGPTIQLAGSDNVDSLRGPDIHHLVVTEFAFCQEGLWKAVRPGLRTARDRALLITTPNGPNFAWDLWKRVEKNKSWKRFQQPTWSNPFHDPDSVQEGRETLSRSHFDQEYGAEFEALEGAIYADFSVNRNVVPVELDTDAEVFVGQDFNAGYVGAVIGQPTINGLNITDELVTRTHIYDHIQRLVHWFESRGIDWRRRVTVVTDSSGEYNATSGESSDAVLMRQHGFRVAHDWQNPKVIDRIHAVQSLILTTTNEVRLRVNERCTELINCLLSQVWNQWHKPDKTKGLDHLPDALGYLTWHFFPIRQETFIETV